ncbi:hypothetical protein [Mycolicibacterium aichiense]|uniref:Uncharacterized protein n=1 Tax=Mycolicibacterium aichiense TaxID=1799 RepID=A0A378VAQ2_9MYCO|nr:hypothetical protein [Mycolicibacterium aichiense]QFG08013.1 hypothetical protein SEA_HERBERTWM_44 [Mycobacterium phage Herbertwm]MCV7016777.1 hypothetical protein [Mycolicibacterium aichiense]SUA14005.1 Uncharacterised protein [Mycolicibacterium aichiense]SUA14417.1 Uncharacterised protein [Mycolicibacterium aichiense]BBX09440.1 hypothetical protein MAIC_42430 [Mycolicibacterium aichiense]
MKVQRIERFSIPITGSRESLSFDGGTTVRTLKRALNKLPLDGKIQLDYSQIIVMHVHDDIEVDGE